MTTAGLELSPMADNRTDLADGFEADLAARLLAGDGSALETAYDTHAAAVFAVAQRVTGSQSTAEELVQEVFLHLWERPERFQPERGGLRTYLAMIVHRRSVDLVRSQVARESREVRVGRPNVAIAGTEERAMASVESQAVRKALDRLGTEKRRCIELAYFAGLTFKQVAEHLELPEGTVKTRIRSALKELNHAT